MLIINSLYYFMSENAKSYKLSKVRIISSKNSHLRLNKITMKTLIY